MCSDTRCEPLRMMRITSLAGFAVDRKRGITMRQGETEYDKPISKCGTCVQPAPLPLSATLDGGHKESLVKPRVSNRNLDERDIVSSD